MFSIDRLLAITTFHLIYLRYVVPKGSSPVRVCISHNLQVFPCQGIHFDILKIIYFYFYMMQRIYYNETSEVPV